MPIACAVTAVSRPGADQVAMSTETTSSESVTTTDCHRKMVSENGIAPVIGSSDFGRLATLARSCAAEDESPIAQVAPSPR